MKLPQWIQCKLCKKWRTIKIPVTQITTWKEPPHWECNFSEDLVSKGGCSAPRIIPTFHTHGALELDALQTQRMIKALRAGINDDISAPIHVRKKQKLNHNYHDTSRKCHVSSNNF